MSYATGHNHIQYTPSSKSNTLDRHTNTLEGIQDTTDFLTVRQSVRRGDDVTKGLNKGTRRPKREEPTERADTSRARHRTEVEEGSRVGRGKQ